jgi:hypothetical protein
LAKHSKIALFAGASSLIITGSVIFTPFPETRVFFLLFAITAEVRFIANTAQLTVTRTIATAGDIVIGAGGHGLVTTLTDETGVGAVTPFGRTGAAVLAKFTHIVANMVFSGLRLATITGEA